MKAIKCQLKMRADMGGHNVLGLLEHVYSQPVIAGHPKQVLVYFIFYDYYRCVVDTPLVDNEILKLTT